jgi:hypothetical protein
MLILQSWLEKTGVFGFTEYYIVCSHSAGGGLAEAAA